MRTKIRAYRKTNFVLIRKFTDYLHRFFIVLKGGAMEEFTKELLDQLNVDTAFTIGPFAFSESVVITWVVMAILVLLSAWLTQGLKVHNPGKKQIVAESIVLWLDKFTISMLGENAKEYSTYISTILLYIGLANIIGIFGMKPPTKDMNVTIALALMSIILIEISGIRAKGMKGWIKSFTQPVAVVTPINILEVFTRPLSLCMRLFGNVIGAFVIMEMIKMVVPVFIPTVFSLYFDFFDGFIQAYVFVFLTSLFIAEATETE